MPTSEEAKAAAAQYEAQNRGGTRRVARHLVTSLLLPFTAAEVVHDNASAAGIVTSEILLCAADVASVPRRIYPTDTNKTFIKAINDQARERQWKNVSPRVADSQDLTSHFADGIFTHSIMNFGIFLLPQPEKAGREMFRTLKPGGTVVLTTWKLHGAIDFAHEVQLQINPDLPLFPPKLGPAESWKSESKPMTFLSELGFVDIQIHETDVASFPFGEDPEEDVELYRFPLWEKARSKEGLTENDVEKWDEIVREHVAKCQQGKSEKGCKMIALIAIAKKPEVG